MEQRKMILEQRIFFTSYQKMFRDAEVFLKVATQLTK